jgi:hypothetical protein
VRNIMDREKYVDESWKESAQQEKDKLAELAAQTSKKKPLQPEEPRQQRPVQPQEPEPQEPHAQAPAEESEEYEGQINFLNYISSLAYQAMIFIGEIPNPNTNLVTKNFEQAKFIIDTLAMLRQKTKGNLTKQESDILNASLYELQMKFVEAYQKETGQP